MQISGSGVQKRPGWKHFDRVNRGNPVPYSKRWDFEDRGSFAWSYDEQQDGGTHFWEYETGPYASSMFPGNSIISSAVQDAEYKALSKLLDEMKGEGANLANMLGERKQVANMVVNTIQRLAYTARDLKRGNLSSAVRRLFGDPKTAKQLRGKDIANQWLELQYGWKPLLGDIYSVINGLHHRELTLPRTFRVTRSSETSGPSDASWSTNLRGVHMGGSRRTKSLCKFMIRAFPNASIAEPAALGFTNPAGVLWEITPWSFVVDWFLPVGTYLDQLTADHGWNFHDGCKSTLQIGGEFASWGYSEGGHVPGLYQFYNEQKKGSTGCVIFDRISLPGFPSPKLPHFKNPFSTAHVWNALALLTQAFSKK
jgi:hypothetical protein